MVNSNSVSLNIVVVDAIVVGIMVVVVLVVDSINCVMVDCFVNGGTVDISAGRMGARTVDDNTNGRSVIKSISSIS